MPGEAVLDAELTRRAQQGDAAALAALLTRHQVGMRAVALSILGPVADVDDVLQDAALAALRHIVDVRDPSAVGPWLKMIVRNGCRMHLRAMKGETLSEPVPVEYSGSPENVINEHAMRDWVWSAIEQLPQTLRLPLMLRHFSSVRSYAEIAAVCEVPVGTIRSRLNAARAQLTRHLAALEDRPHADATALVQERSMEGLETLKAAERGAFASVVADRWSPEVELIAGGQRGGRDLLLHAMDADLEAGVRQRLRHTTASAGLTIWEMDLLNSPHNPERCPPSVAWILSERQGRIQSLRLFHPARPFLDVDV
ncbi:sigma-70 family RNA polymerase sigma factor [Streptomyces sp. NPDC006207]